MASRAQLAERLLVLAADASDGGAESHPLIELGCIALVRGLALDRYRQSLLAHVFMDLTGLLNAPETGAVNSFAVIKPTGQALVAGPTNLSGRSCSTR